MWAFRERTLQAAETQAQGELGIVWKVEEEQRRH